MEFAQMRFHQTGTMILTPTVHPVGGMRVARQALTYNATRRVSTSSIHTDTNKLPTFINI